MTDVYTPDANSLSGQFAVNQLGSVSSYEDMPLLFDLASSAPGATTATLWNVNRVSNTIVKGGKRGAFLNRGGLDSFKSQLPQMFGQTFSPRNFNKLSSARNIEGTGGAYSPFNFLASVGNKGAVRMAKSTKGRETLNRLRMGQDIDFEQDAFARGAFGRMAATTRIGEMKESKFLKRSDNIRRAIGDISPDAQRRLTTALNNPWKNIAFTPEFSPTYSRGAYVGALGSTNNGYISGRVAGAFDTAQALRLDRMTGTTARVMGIMDTTAGTNYGTGARWASQHADNTIVKIAGSRGASMAARAAGPIGWMLLARDLTKMSGKLVGTLGRTIADAGSELNNSLNGGPLEGTFKDNAVAATARQRGAMAIANSRMNARSVLGNEAASLHAYYG